ncbi:MAG: endonuclease VIII [Clostridiaceae bacterium]
MLEIPESNFISEQLNKTIKGKTVKNIYANKSTHKFAFFFGDPAKYQALLQGKNIGKAIALGGMIEIEAEDARILFSDGANIRYFEAGEPLPEKHQLHIEFEDHTSLVCTIQMYGGLWAYKEGANDNPYYLAAKEKPSPLSDEFSESYFEKLIEGEKGTLSIKALLATEQRIPGLGNGVLQDILFKSGINPKTKLASLSKKDKNGLFRNVKHTLKEMTEKGGRDTEKDLFGNPGGYKTLMSGKSWKNPCPLCGGNIEKQAYMGGSIYYCKTCQPVKEA